MTEGFQPKKKEKKPVFRKIVAAQGGVDLSRQGSWGSRHERGYNESKVKSIREKKKEKNLEGEN